MRKRYMAAALCCLFLAPACAQAHSPDPHEMPVLELDGRGLTLLDVESGEKSQVRFGTRDGKALAEIATAVGAPTGKGSNQDCDAGPLAYTDFQGGLRLFLRDGRFVGWQTDGGWSTAGGVRVGMSRTELQGAAGSVPIEDTSLGLEFSIDGIQGLIDPPAPQGVVASLWAGIVCMMR